ncbi:MAG: hypothetical protein NPINA01_28460 [Nitrospinaceae bacterium]|nr:MAG: hypothetical protein NPINA01_28460 [Nitrospinaceae bacterium]
MHSVTINPALPVSRSDIGRNIVLNVKVIDSRPSNLISNWKGKLNFRSFRIAPDEDLTAVLQNKIENGLQNLGFVPKRNPVKQTPALTVEILRLKSVYHKKSPNLGLKVESVLRARCQNINQTYKMDYKERLTRNPIIPTSFPNETLVNASLSGSLKKMFSDKQLLHCLAR